MTNPTVEELLKDCDYLLASWYGPSTKRVAEALRERLVGEQPNGWLPLRDAPEFVNGRDALVGQWTERGWQKVTIWEHFWTRNQCIDRGATHWWPHLSELPPPPRSHQMESETVKRWITRDLTDSFGQEVVPASAYDALAAQVRELKEQLAECKHYAQERNDYIGLVVKQRDKVKQQRDEALQSIATAREEAIRACESERLSLQKIGAVHAADQAYENAITYCQNAIRALKPKGGEKV